MDEADDEERCRLERDRTMLFTALDELLSARNEAERGGSTARLGASWRQAEQIRDAALQQAGDKHPYCIFYCEEEGGHTTPHRFLPHRQLVIHGPRQVPEKES